VENDQTDAIPAFVQSLTNTMPKCTPFMAKIDIEGFEDVLFYSNTDWIERFPVIIIELHDWMLPGKANSTNFLRAIAEYDRDLLFRGENVVSIANAKCSFARTPAGRHASRIPQQQRLAKRLRSRP
jgi:hypothetical protein